MTDETIEHKYNQLCELCGEILTTIGLEGNAAWFKDFPDTWSVCVDNWQMRHDRIAQKSVELTRAELVTVLRKRKRWTKTHLAFESGLSRNYITQIESGEADNLSERVLFALADALGAEVFALLRRPGK